MAERGEGYMFYNSPTTNLSGVYRRDAGTDTLLGTPVLGVYAPSADTEFLMSIADGKIMVYSLVASVWEQLVTTVSDSTYSTTEPVGVRTNRTGNTFDDFGVAELSNTGWVEGSSVSVGLTGDFSWTDQSNILTADTNTAYINNTVLEASSDRLDITGFSFPGISTGDLIAGIEVKAIVTTNSRGPESPGIQLLKTTPVGNPQFGAASTGDIIIGEPTDVWGTTWSPSDLDSNFGVAFWVNDTNGLDGFNFAIDAIQVRIWYVVGSINASVTGVPATSTASISTTRPVRWPSAHITIR